MARTRSVAVAAQPAPRSRTARLADAGLILAFLGLAFLLGCFPLKDTDFWWHLRTGDLIRAGAGFPVEDWYTFGAEGYAWIDLHWLFEVLLSVGYEHVGIVGLNLAKCLVTCLALGLLVTARRPDWPVWVMLLAWLPALFVLGGRMYVRPETLTLLYLAIFLAVLMRWEDYPKLAFVLPAVQVFWVNTQGLFVLGPIVLACAWVDAALRPGAFAASRRPWWRTVVIASGLTLAACVVNPYGLLGAVFPLQLARTMGDPIFSRTIAELMPVVSLSPADPYSFVSEMGYRSLPLQFHLATLTLGALSFLVPITWRASVRLRGAAGATETPEPPRKGKRKGAKKGASTAAPLTPEGWRLRPFRVLLFLAFSLLSLKATRNSHQFAAVVGAITAWNLGEWAAALRRRHRERERSAVPESTGPGVWPRLATLAVLGLAGAAVGSGWVYALAGEGRTIGLGQEPLWFPHDAARFAGQAGMPPRFVCFHNGHSALYEYYNGPERKVYTDARLEVMGAELYAQYLELERRIRTDDPGWDAALRALGDPGVLVDNVHTSNAPTVASLMAHPRWRCVWFDAIASVFVPDSATDAPGAVDFARRHFQPDPEPGSGPTTPAALNATANALYNVAFDLSGRGRVDRAQPMIVLGLAHARRSRQLNPGPATPWKLGGLLESTREPFATETPTPRFRLPFDPVFDLSPARATYLLTQALERTPEDTKSLFALALSLHGRGMYEAALPLEQRIAALDPPHQTRAVTRMARQKGAELAAQSAAALGPEPPATWRNLDELDRAISARLRTGRARSAAELLERAYPPDVRPWEVADRIATLHLHLGQPDQARAAWRSVLGRAPRPALVAARIGATHLVEDDFEAARTAYRRALAVEPDLFEAHYGLAVVELDAGRATAAAEAAQHAGELAPNSVAAAAVRAIASLAAPFASETTEPESND